MASEEIAEMAERASEAAQHAAEVARKAAQKARDNATASRDTKLREADDDVVNAHAAAARAGEIYHKAEADARARHESNS